MNNRTLNDFRFQYTYTKYQVSPPYSHGDWPAGDFAARLPFCTPVFSYPSIRSVAAATRRWVRSIAGSSRTTSRT